MIKQLKSNKMFIIMTIVFVVIVTFVDKNNLVDSWSVQKKIRLLEDQREYYIQKIEEDSIILQNLTDNQYLERIARENYMMKRADETIYIVK